MERNSKRSRVLVNTSYYKVFVFQMSKLDTKNINERLEEVFIKLDSAAKTKIATEFVLHNVEMWESWHYYAHENNTLFEKLHLLCRKAHLITIQGKVENFDIVEQCTQERQNTNGGLN